MPFSQTDAQDQEMLIAHISDFHIFAEAPETSVVRSDTAEAARKVVADIAAFMPKISAIMFTGDLTDGGSPEDYSLLAGILAPIDVPIFAIPGNHDKRDGIRAMFNKQLPFGPGPFLNYEGQFKDIRILALDTLLDGQIQGGLDPTQLAWLEDKLAAPTKELTLILMHHPAFPSAIAALDHMALQDGRDTFARLIAAYQGPLRILSGHIHRPFQTIWNGVFCAVSGGPAFQHDLVLDPAALEAATVDEPYAYFIHRIHDEETVSIHTRYVEL